MRQITRNLEKIGALGAEVLVVTSDSPGVIAEAGFDDLRIASGDTALWTALGIVNPERPELPHPTTFVVDSSGTVLLQETFVDYRKRLPIPDMLAALESAPAAAPVKEPVASTGPDWEGGVTFTTGGADDCLSLTADIAEGFHLYGARETTARPLSVTVNEAPHWQVPIQDGTQKDLSGLGTAWIISGMTSHEWPLPSADLPRTLTGTIDYQLCTETACSPPSSQPFTVSRIEGRCSTPDQLD